MHVRVIVGEGCYDWVIRLMGVMMYNWGLLVGGCNVEMRTFQVRFWVALRDVSCMYLDIPQLILTNQSPLISFHHLTGVYARVGQHYDWIAKTICEVSDDPPAYFKCPPRPRPLGNPNDAMVDIKISFRFDDYRAETGWVLESIPDFRNIRYRPFGTYKSMNSVDANNSISETVSVQSGRFYMLSVLDEFADGFCCSVGEGYFKVDHAGNRGKPIVETTPGILWTPHSLRRAFYVSDPQKDEDSFPPDYVTIVVTLGMGADPGKFLLVALENIEYEALMTYEIRPFVSLDFDSSRVSGISTNSGSSASGTMIYSRAFKVPVLGVEFERQRYNVMVVDDNEGQTSKANFEVYLGEVHPNNLILGQSGNYGDGNNISRSFVLFKKAGGSGSAFTSDNDSPTTGGMDFRQHSNHATTSVSFTCWVALFAPTLAVVLTML